MPFLNRGELAVDDVTRCAIDIDFEHHEIHEGDMFTAHYEVTPSDTGDMTAIGFTTPAAAVSAKRIHLIVDVYAGAGSTFQVIENPTVVPKKGVVLPVFNRNRNSATTSVLIDHGAAAGAADPVTGQLTSYDEDEAADGNVEVGGTVLFEQTIGVAGNPANIEAGQARSQREFICKIDEDYTFVLTCLTDADTQHNITLNWYEHTDEN